MWGTTRIRSWAPSISYLLYINDPHNSLTVLKSVLFADDCSAYASGSDIPKLVQDVNSDLDSLSEWFYSNKLSLNTEKSVYAIFTNRVIRKEINIKIKGRHLLRKEQVTFLGIIVDNKLTWNEHIKWVKGKFSSSLYILKQWNIFLHTTFSFQFFVLPLSKLWHFAVRKLM